MEKWLDTIKTLLAEYFALMAKLIYTATDGDIDLTDAIEQITGTVDELKKNA